jgi:hypothetical protein
MEDANIQTTIGPDARKAHNKSAVITSDVERDFKTNSNYAQQHIVWSTRHGEYRTRKDGANWKVHPMLLLVSVSVTLLDCKYFC